VVELVKEERIREFVKYTGDHYGVNLHVTGYFSDVPSVLGGHGIDHHDLGGMLLQKVTRPYLMGVPMSEV